MTSVPVLLTIGYESADLADFLDTLRAAGVTLLVDTRERAQSRRPGYSKTALAAALLTLLDVGVTVRPLQELQAQSRSQSQSQSQSQSPTSDPKPREPGDNDRR